MAIKTAGPKPSTKPKRPVIRCEGGHRQGVNWRPGDGCPMCAEAGYAARRLLDTAPIHVPDVMTVTEGRTGRVTRFAIPRGIRRRYR